jgi:RNA polymerase sigma-70 factor (ECF subfamily)
VANTSEPPDDVLIVSLAERDLGALATLYDRYGRLAYALAYRILGEGPAAEDVVHDAYLRSREKIDQLRDLDALDAWLTRIVIATAYNANRRRRGLRAKLALLSRSRPSPQEPDAGLDELIEQLAPRERVVLVLQHAYGYRLDEIARIVGTSHTNARTIAHRARRHLAAAWKQADR